MLFPLALVFIALGLLQIGLALPLIGRRVPPNAFYGYRVRQTLTNPDLWYPVNEYAGRLLALVGVVGIPLAVIIALVPGMRPETYALAMCAIFVAGAMVATLLGWRYLRQLTQERA